MFIIIITLFTFIAMYTYIIFRQGASIILKVYVFILLFILFKSILVDIHLNIVFYIEIH